MECPICYEVINKNKYWNPCGHLLCKNCFNLWYLKNNNKNCPLCRLKYQKKFWDQFDFTKFYMYDAWANCIIVP